MRGAGIFDGDLLVIDRGITPQPDDIVIAVIHGELTVKRLERQGSSWQLICPLLGGPKSMLFWTRKEKTNAIQETHAGGDYRQAA